jgi:protein SCO1/2
MFARVFGLFILIFVGGCKPSADSFSPGLQPSPEHPPRLHKYWRLQGFELQDQSGTVFSLSSMMGKVWVVDFFYSSCPGPCPALTSRLSELHRAFEDEDRVRFLSVSSDPEKDSPAVLRAYAEKFRADSRWFFLTGAKTEVYRLANEGFKLSLKEMSEEKEPISHSTRLALVDTDGWIRGFYEGIGEDSPSSTQRLREDIRELLH